MCQKTRKIQHKETYFPLWYTMIVILQYYDWVWSRAHKTIDSNFFKREKNPSKNYKMFSLTTNFSLPTARYLMIFWSLRCPISKQRYKAFKIPNNFCTTATELAKHCFAWINKRIIWKLSYFFSNGVHINTVPWEKPGLHKQEYDI